MRSSIKVRTASRQCIGLFSRLHNAYRYAGTGIGLAICQRIVERYHARIWVESEAGRGSDFRFTLPSRAWQILIAEDSKSDVFLIRQALTKAEIDAQIHVANDGEKTVRFLESTDADPAAPCPDLILLDINMPCYKGGDVLRRLRASARCKDALVVVVTSSDLQRDRGDMDAFGAAGYFRKPSQFSDL